MLSSSMPITTWMPDRSGGPAGYVNHGCYPNCAIKKKRGGLWLTSIRPIEQGEELLIDYDFELGEEFAPCKCGHSPLSRTDAQKKRLAETAKTNV